jgi:hypothetical protein
VSGLFLALAAILFQDHFISGVNFVFFGNVIERITNRTSKTDYRPVSFFSHVDILTDKLVNAT